MKRVRGFTLLELLVVVTVVAILAGFAISSYSEQVRKSKRSEAIKGIAQFQLLMEKFRANCPTYADVVAGPNNCRDRTGDGDGDDPGDLAYPALAAGDNYTFGITGADATNYVVTATKKATFADSKCGNYVMTVSPTGSARTMSGGTQPLAYCWP